MKLAQWVAMLCGLLAASGCTTNPYRLHTDNQRGAGAPPLESGAVIILDQVNVVAPGEPDGTRYGSGRELSTPVSVEPQPGARRQDIETDQAALVRGNVVDSLKWLGYKVVNPGDDDFHARIRVRVSAVSEVKTYTTTKDLYATRKTGTYTSYCYENFFGGVSCNHFANSEQYKYDTVPIRVGYRLTSLKLQWFKDGELIHATALSTDKDHCTLKRRLEILSSEGLRQSLKRTTSGDIDVRVPEGYCG